MVSRHVLRLGRIASEIVEFNRQGPGRLLGHSLPHGLPTAVGHCLPTPLGKLPVEDTLGRGGAPALERFSQALSIQPSRLPNSQTSQVQERW